MLMRGPKRSKSSPSGGREKRHPKRPAPRNLRRSPQAYDENGELSGDRVEGSTFPNWVGDVRTRKELHLVVGGDRTLENFQRPEGTKIVITWQRVR
jgi:hypothetical protein